MNLAISKYFDIFCEIDERFEILDYLLQKSTGDRLVATLKDIADNTKLTQSQVNKFMKLLEQKQLVIRERNGVIRLGYQLLALKKDSNFDCYTYTIKNIPVVYFQCNFDQFWTVQFISNECSWLTGYEAEIFINNQLMPFNKIIVPEYQNMVYEKWQQAIAEKRKLIINYEIITAMGDRKWVYEIGNGIYEDNGTVQYLEGCIFDANRFKVKVFNTISMHDIWTGLWNHSALLNYLDNSYLTNHNKRYLLLINIELLNKMHWASYANHLIFQKITSQLLSCCGPTCALYKYNVNSFLILMEPNKSKNALSEFHQLAATVSETLALIFKDIITFSLFFTELNNNEKNNVWLSQSLNTLIDPLITESLGFINDHAPNGFYPFVP